MHLIKTSDYFLAFDKKVAKEKIDIFKNEILCVLDFEAFQFYPYDRDKFKSIKLMNIPYTVCLNTLVWDENKQLFVSNNEKVWQFQDDWQDELGLLERIEKLAIVIADYVSRNKINRFIFMGKNLEEKALDFMVNNLAIGQELKEFLLIKSYDLYDYFFKEKNFYILSYKHKVSTILKTMMSSYGDEYQNFEIGEDGMKHFKNHIRGLDANQLNFEKVKEHSAFDLKKGVDLLNYLQILASWPNEEVINYKELEAEKKL